MELPTIETIEPDDDDTLESSQSSKRHGATLIIMSLTAMFLLGPLFVVASYLYVTNLPMRDLVPTELTIEPGTSVWNIAKSVQSAGIVRSEFTLFLALRYLEDPTQIKASTYYFDSPQTTREVAQTLIAGEFSNNLQSITFVEGMRAREYAATAAKLPNVTEDEFLEQTSDLEGKLFPETYFVPSTISTTDLVALLQNMHEERVNQYADQIRAQNLTIDEALILASIIEREANTPESMRTVAGIFLNRLNIGMALQADASVEYVIETPLGELPPGRLASELRELDSPYNTYLYPGLPPTPIGNPGENAILAIANPAESEYLYYITGNDGNFYYAETYDEHLNNIARYLR